MSGRFYALCLVGMLGSLFVGYCIYFDKKRRSAPDYKKKVLASERQGCSGCDSGARGSHIRVAGRSVCDRDQNGIK